MSRLIGFLVLGYVLGFAAFMTLLPRPAGRERTDAVVVMTGGANRLDRGLEVVRDGLARRLLVSGVGTAVRPADLAKQSGFPPALFGCCVDLGHDAVDTRSNADETARWLRRGHYASVRLVTTDWHMARARFELSHELRRKGGAPIAILADPVRSEPSFSTMLNEYNKLLLRRAAVMLGL